MTREERIARRDELKAQIDARPTWGAAVGAMYEELHGLEQALKAPEPPKEPTLRTSLEGLLTMYVDLVNSGDIGNYDPEKVEEVIAARTALARHDRQLSNRALDILCATYAHFSGEGVNRTAMRIALEDIQQSGFQARCQKWLDVVTESDPTDLQERIARFVEEALELAQSLGFSAQDVEELVRYVFNRPPGEPHQEFGGAHTTLAVLAGYTGYNLQACSETELARCWDPAVIEKIRGKRSRRHGRGPLPGTTEADLVPGA